MPEDKSIQTIERQPVVVVLGHVDHGKTTLLDFIKKTAVAGGEAGGITQHTGAYEVVHKDEEGRDRRITFIDTPGHAAFSAMRKRGAAVADIAILVVAGDDGVKPQTLEAISAIKEANIPYIVAINKIDKPGINLDKTKQGLAEADVYVEGYGGTVPFCPVSAKTGEGIDALLSLILLSASLEELTADKAQKGKGVVIESHRDAKSGTLATLIILDGTLKRGDSVVVATEAATLRSMNDWTGKQIDEAGAGRPVQASGFKGLPEVGEEFLVYDNKRDALEKAENLKLASRKPKEKKEVNTEIVIPLVIKADTTGTLEAIISELDKRVSEKVGLKVVTSGVGSVVESDIKVLVASSKPIVIAFNAPVDRHAEDLAMKNAVRIEHFDIIYKLTEWLDEYIKEITPKIEEKITEGEAKILKVFSRNKDKQVLGGMVLKGKISKSKRVTIMRREEKIGEGKISNLQKMRVDADSVNEGEQFGAVIEAKIGLAEGDVIEV